MDIDRLPSDIGSLQQEKETHEKNTRKTRKITRKISNPFNHNFSIVIECIGCYNMSMMSIKEIQEKLTVLKGKRDIHKVILFGSYARGDVTRKSDMDMVVIMDTNKRFFDRYELLDSLYDLFDTGLDIFPYTEEEFSRISHRPFIKSIIKEGVVVYES